jgi:hydrogenase nickel incorporation protein HypA/HybF
MHELSVCEALFDMIAKEREARRFTRVCRVRLAVGRFSCLEPEALRYAFEILIRETFLEHATLEIDCPPGRAVCLDCGAEIEVESRLDDCPLCKGGRLKPTGGDDMRFIEMEVI